VRFLRTRAKQWHIDPDRFALWGESAGADLATLVAVVGDRHTVLDGPEPALDATSARVQAVVDWYGPIDLAGRPAQFHTGGSDCSDPQLAQADHYTTGYLGAEVGRVPERAAAANPLTYLNSAPAVPPFSIAHGTADCLVPVAQSENLAAALRAAGGRVDLHILRGAVHADPRFDREVLAPTISWLTTVLDRAAVDPRGS
jgi:acetyl esterase/lipase